jgi:hypothetical protein
MKSVHITDIIATYNPGPGRHWFDRDTLKFFSCTLPTVGFSATDGSVYFVSSEKPPFSPRKYSVRRLVGEGRIETVGEFCGYKTKARATTQARKLAEGGAK